MISLFMLFLLPFATPSMAQDGRVDCGSGFHCPKGNACLLGGFCGVEIDALPGSIPSATRPDFFL